MWRFVWLFACFLACYIHHILLLDMGTKKERVFKHWWVCLQQLRMPHPINLNHCHVHNHVVWHQKVVYIVNLKRPINSCECAEFETINNNIKNEVLVVKNQINSMGLIRYLSYGLQLVCFFGAITMIVKYQYVFDASQHSMLYFSFRRFNKFH